MNNWAVFLAAILGTFMLTFAGELTFELPDNERQCFHEVIEKGIKCTIEFQVIYSLKTIICMRLNGCYVKV